MITNFNSFLITEIADTVVTPNILQQKFDRKSQQWTYWIQVKERVYLVRISIGDPKSAVVKIDFMIEDGIDYTAIRTNDGDALLVMANIIAVVNTWIKDSNLEEDTLVVGIWINSKSEEEGDERRSKMYRYYLYKTLEKLGVKIIEEKDITQEWNKKNNIVPVNKKPLIEKPGRNYVQDKYIFMQYKIEPITVEELRNKL